MGDTLTERRVVASEPDAAALYRRYRPARFADLIGQDDAANALQRSVTDGRSYHAWLFTGPRGTGKTSAARILARALNCESRDGSEPCGSCGSCLQISAGSSLDVVELDAASNNGVDAVRDIVSAASIGSPGRRKVFVLDEAHMLTTQASNALLKTLEDPPEHVVFILATTDPQKLLPTVKSRCVQLSFRLVDRDALTEHLAAVADDAGIDVTADQISEAVRRGRGSVRDALSALDAVWASGSDNTDADSGPEQLLADALSSGDVAASIRTIAEACTGGSEPRQLLEATIAELRERFLATMGSVDLMTSPSEERLAASRQAGPRRIVNALEHLGEALVTITAGHEPRITLEVAAVRAAKASTST